MKVSNLAIPSRLIELRVFDFGEVYFFENYVISEFYEGVNLTKREVSAVIEHALSLYDHKRTLIYISNRINSYSANPFHWVELMNKYKDQVTMCIVCYQALTRRIFEIEALFSKIPMKCFADLTEVVNWAESQCD